jgi:hypothetical protein
MAMLEGDAGGGRAEEEAVAGVPDRPQAPRTTAIANGISPAASPPANLVSPGMSMLASRAGYGPPWSRVSSRRSHLDFDGDPKMAVGGPEFERLEQAGVPCAELTLPSCFAGRMLVLETCDFDELLRVLETLKQLPGDEAGAAPGGVPPKLVMEADGGLDVALPGAVGVDCEEHPCLVESQIVRAVTNAGMRLSESGTTAWPR